MFLLKKGVLSVAIANTKSHIFFFFFSAQNIFIFFLFLHVSICCEYSLETLLMSTHNICFSGEIRKNINWMPFLSRAIKFVTFF